MKAIDQKIQNHTAEEPGDCFAACVAMLTGAALENVPAVGPGESSADYLARVGVFLSTLGLHLIGWTVADNGYPYVGAVALGITDDYWIGSGMYGGTPHAVVYCGDLMWHDPHRFRMGLDTVASVYRVAPLDPSMWVRK